MWTTLDALSVPELVALEADLASAMAAIAGGGHSELERALRCRQQEVCARAVEVAQQQIGHLVELTQCSSEFAKAVPDMGTAAYRRRNVRERVLAMELAAAIAAKLEGHRASLRSISDVAAKARMATLHLPDCLPLPPPLAQANGEGSVEALDPRTASPGCTEVLRAAKQWIQFMHLQVLAYKAANLAFFLDPNGDSPTGDTPTGDLPEERRLAIRHLLPTVHRLLMDLEGRGPPGLLDLFQELEELTELE